MTKRAILWCGHVREPILVHHERGAREPTDEQRELYGIQDALSPTDDATIQHRSLELAYEAVQALGVARADVHACVIHDDLLPQGFDPANRHPATIDGLRALIRRLAQRAAPNDPLLFIAVNHCGSGALATATPVDELDDDVRVERLTPTVLDECLRPLEGPQVFVIATCYAGIFLPLASPHRRAIFAACAANEVYQILRQDNTQPTFLDELFGAWCGCALSDAVDRAHLSLDAAFSRAVARLTAARAPYQPQQCGSLAWPP